MIVMHWSTFTQFMVSIEQYVNKEHFIYDTQTL